MILTDPQGAVPALLAAVEAKRRGARVRFGVALPEPRIEVAQTLAAQILATPGDAAARRGSFDALRAGSLVVDGVPQHALSALDPRTVATLRDALLLADTVLVRSREEIGRIERVLHLVPRDPIVVLAPPARMASPREDAERILVWAPHHSGAQASLALYALVELGLPLALVHGSGAASGENLRTYAPAGGADALQEARVVVTIDGADPHEALALAAAGYRVAAPLASGAHERASTIAYDAADWLDTLRAVEVALAAPAPLPVTEEGPLVFADAPLPVDGPLVSLVVRTYNRPRFLERALASIAQQRYRSVEAIVVNDGGAPVHEIVTRYPFARTIDRATNGGVSVAANDGLRAARGTYVGLLDDDDVLFADHLARLVDALERANADAANTGTLSAYLERTPYSDYALYGLRAGPAGHIDHTDVFLRDPVGPMNVLMRREFLARIGFIDERITYAEDWELWMRVAAHTDVVFVPHLTALYAVRSDGTNTVVTDARKFAGALETMLAAHPHGARPRLRQAREQMTAAARDALEPRWPPPAIRFEPPLPLP